MWEDLLLISCSCCPDDTDYLKIQRNKKFDTDPEEIAYYYSFRYTETWPLKERIRKYLKIVKHAEEFKTGSYQLANGFPIDLDQLSEFFYTLYDDAQVNAIITEEDIEYINNYNKTKFNYFYDDPEDKNWYDGLIHKTEDGLVLGAMFYNDVEKNQTRIMDFTLGWAAGTDYSTKDLKKYALRHVLNPKRKHFVLEYEGFLYKKDVVKFLAIMSSFLNHIDANGGDDPLFNKS